MRRFALLGASIAVAAFIATMPLVASAATITQTDSINPAQPTDWVAMLKVNKFNSALGTLTKVTVKFTYGLAGFVKYESLNAQAQKINLELNGNTGLLWAGTSTQVTDSQVFNWSTTVDAPSYDGRFDWAGTSGGTAKIVGDPYTVPVTPEWSTPKVAEFTGTAMNAFQGSGEVNFDAYSNFSSATKSSGRVASWYQTDTAAKVEVIYEYAVPEPGSMLALATGLIGVLGAAYKKRS